jgi:type IV secretory pathway VirJ component
VNRGNFGIIQWHPVYDAARCLGQASHNLIMRIITAVVVPLLALPLAAQPALVAGPRAIAIAQAQELRDLPITEIPALGGDSTTLALFLTGDGGWAALPTHLTKYLAARGVAIAGINMRSYLSKERTPDGVASDMTRVLNHYLSTWHREHVIVIGYSRGADIAPFIVARLPAELRARVALVAMLGIAKSANFEFHLIDLIRDVERESDRPTAPELERLRGTRMLCFYGTEEDNSACRSADSTLVTRIARVGGHQINGDFDVIGAAILRAIPR